MKTTLFILAISIASNLFSQTCSAPVEILVTNMKNQPITGDKIIFVGKKSRKTFSGITAAKGVFMISLPCGDTYEIKVASIGEAIDYNELAIPTLAQGESFQDMKLHITYDLPKEFILADLQFESAKAIIQTTSYHSLNELADYLKRKPNTIIEIEGHTDSEGDDQTNLTLSQARANAVKNYLIAKGIQAKQLKATGFGETRPVAENNTAAGRQQNRRTEISVLSN